MDAFEGAGLVPPLQAVAYVEIVHIVGRKIVGSKRICLPATVYD